MYAVKENGMAAERTFTDGRLTTKFKMVSADKPSEEQIRRVQGRLGYSPYGYGGPWSIVSVCKDGIWHTTWSCSGSCD